MAQAHVSTYKGHHWLHPTNHNLMSGNQEIANKKNNTVWNIYSGFAHNTVFEEATATCCMNPLTGQAFTLWCLMSYTSQLALKIREC